MPPIKKTQAELVERLRAIAQVLRDIPPEHTASGKRMEHLQKEIRAIAVALLKRG